MKYSRHDEDEETGPVRGGGGSAVNGFMYGWLNQISNQKLVNRSSLIQYPADTNNQTLGLTLKNTLLLSTLTMANRGKTAPGKTSGETRMSVERQKRGRKGREQNGNSYDSRLPLDRAGVWSHLGTAEGRVALIIYI